MLILRERISKKSASLTWHNLFRDEDGAIDLASIMVGIIVIGLIGGVIAATVFAVIPWTQDNAAKQQLDSVVAAQSAYMGLSSTVPSSLPAAVTGAVANSYGTSIQLEQASLLARGGKYCTVTTNGGKGYQSFSRSDSTKVFSASDQNTKAQEFTGALPTDCAFIGTGTALAAAPYVDPTPTQTILTYNCPSTSTGTIPMKAGLTGTETWSDGFAPRSYTNASAALPRTLTANVNYTVTFDGTYQTFSSTGDSSEGLAACLRSVDHWGANTGVTSAYRAFLNTYALTAVPDHIPTTITNMSGMMLGATVLNDPNVGKWDVSNVTDMTQMFTVAKVFNQDLSGWNTGKVTRMYSMFENAWAFNKPIENWNTSSVTNMSYMFHLSSVFNQNLGKWNTSNVTDMSYMFQDNTKFNGVVSGWDTSKVSNMAYMFSGASSFNQSLNDLNVSNVVSMDTMLYNDPVYNQPMDKWNTGKVNNMSMLFMGDISFNQNIDMWNVSNVTNFTRVFATATAFNQPLNDWNMSNAQGTAQMFHTATSFNQPLDKWNTAKVSTMFQMFYNNTAFNQYIKGWNVAAVTNSTDFRYGAALTAANSPF